jgi:hypothetical protein
MQDEAAVYGDIFQEKQDDYKGAADSTLNSARGERTSFRDSSAVDLSNKKSGKMSGTGKSTSSKAIKKGASGAKKGK